MNTKPEKEDRKENITMTHPTTDTYEHHSHQHCWETKDPPCGLGNNHKRCCLCDLLPTTDNSLKYNSEMRFSYLPHSKPIFYPDWNTIRPRWWESEFAEFFLITFGALTGTALFFAIVGFVIVLVTNYL